PSRDTIGPLARGVADAAIILDVIAGYDPCDPVTAGCFGHVAASYRNALSEDGLAGIRLGVISQPMAKDTNPEAPDFQEVRAVIRQALEDMTALGASVEEVAIP